MDDEDGGELGMSAFDIDPADPRSRSGPMLATIDCKGTGKERAMTIDRIKPGAWNARAVVHGGLAYLSGIVAQDKTADVKGQTEQVLAQIDGFLAEAGTDKSRILSATVYMADLSQKDAMNEVWMAWLDPACLPARAAVGVELTPGTQVEIMLVAAV